MTSWRLISVRRHWLVVAMGLLLLHLSIWIGPYGYGDLYEYATISEQLWNHGSFALPDGRQSRFCWGFPVLCLPWQACGAAMEALFARNDLSRWVLALFPLLATVSASALVYAVPGRGSARDRYLAVILVGLSTTSLYYSRQLHLEPVVGLALIGAIVLAERPGTVGAIWAGLLLGLAVSCHYAYLPGVAVLALGLAIRRWIVAERGRALALLGLFVLMCTLTPLFNALRYGNLWQDGYSRTESVGWRIGEVGANLPSLALVLFSTPWLILCVAWPSRRLTLPLVIGLACACQVMAWLGTWQFRVFPLRYMMVWIMLLGILLPSGIARLRRWRMGTVVLRWCVLLSLLMALLFMAGWEESRAVIIDPHHPLYPGQVITNVWYVPKAPPFQSAGAYLWILPPYYHEVLSPYCRPDWRAALLASFFLLVGTLLVVMGRPGADGGSLPPRGNPPPG